MKKLWPRSMFARLMLILLVGIFLVHVVGIAIFIEERQRLSRESMFVNVAQDLASIADILDDLAPEERHRALKRQARRYMRLALDEMPTRVERLPDDPMLPVLRRAMPDRDPAVYLQRREEDPSQYRHIVVVKLGDRTPLFANLRRPPELPPIPPLSVIFAALSTIFGISVLTWFCVRIATRPLSNMAAAAHALGEDPERAPLELAGPTEVVQAAEAFNHMQQRILAHMQERTRILAAISHDLQTPITRLRLRAEMVDDDDLRDRIQNDLDAMQTLIREGLTYARSMDSSAPPQPIDLNGLLAALASEAADTKWTVAVSGQVSAPFLGQPVALRRALWNLIENGIKYGKEVDIALSETPDAFRIAIRDHGPGLPPQERERVFEPFYRTEASRNRETGGTGLGLAITRNLLHVQRGSVTLDNHPEGGLVATVVLPRA
ncbi:MAG: HAMP domain-containing protein [Azoarcus sp.]|jgi:protein-histidine pros-kinase|nr:HAMP domain-containing protein [Azoarcus sp.]